MVRHTFSISEKMRILQLAEKTGNVSQVCRENGISRSQFYEYKRRFDSQGIDGLVNLPPIHKNHPQKTPPDIVRRITDLSLEHPVWGCSRLSKELDRNLIHISSPTIQRILSQNQMRSKLDRISILEDRAVFEDLQLSDEQTAAIGKVNPCFKERHRKSNRPGELLIQDTFLMGTFKGIGKMYLHMAIDTFSCYVFANLSNNRLPISAVILLNNSVLPFYSQLGLKINVVETSNSRCFQGDIENPYELCVICNDITHVNTKGKAKTHKLFTEKFYNIVVEEFFREAMAEKEYSNVDEITPDLQDWLLYYNNERAFEGYPNMGAVPMQKIDTFLLL